MGCTLQTEINKIIVCSKSKDVLTRNNYINLLLRITTDYNMVSIL